MKTLVQITVLAIFLADSSVHAAEACRVGRVCTLRASTIGCRATPDVVHETLSQSNGRQRTMAELDLSRFLAVSICRPLRVGSRVIPVHLGGDHVASTMQDEPDTQLFTLDAKAFN